MDPINPVRLARLAKLFNKICSDGDNLSPNNYCLFLESIYENPDAATCLNKLVTSPKQRGLTALQSALRSDASPSFLNGHATRICTYLSSPNLRAIRDGEYLDKVISRVVDPPIFWDAFVDALKTRTLSPDGQAAFSWLLLQVITSPPKEIMDTSLYLEIAEDEIILRHISESSSPTARTYGYQIKYFLESNAPLEITAAGGRHDNDHPDIRQIAILPTADELACNQPSFLRDVGYLEMGEMPANIAMIHADNQFRLLREDMLGEIREEIQIAIGQKAARHRGLVLENIRFDGLFIPPDMSRSRVGIQMQCTQDLWLLKGIKEEKKRKARLDEKKGFLKHQSLSCLIIDDQIIGFPTVQRDENLLAKYPPIITVVLDSVHAIAQSLVKLKTGRNIKLVQIDTAVFSYEPFLTALQEVQKMPLENEILRWTPGNEKVLLPSSGMLHALIQRVEANPTGDLKDVLNLKNSVHLDESQAVSFLSGLRQTLSLIQGPPGTGKSYIGALQAKAIHDYTDKKILVVCYTNHALDQFLEDLMNIGIPPGNITRLGGKGSQKTAHLNLFQQAKSVRLGREDWAAIRAAENDIDGVRKTLSNLPPHYKYSTVSYQSVLDYLEFEEPEFFDALSVSNRGDMKTVGKKGKGATADYLLRQWKAGKDAGALRTHPNVLAAPEIWTMVKSERDGHFADWTACILLEQSQIVAGRIVQYNAALDAKDAVFSQGNVAVMRNKRIIACTTTGAAMNRKDLKSAAPDVLLVEEAGEILESHVICSLGSSVRQTILIGDHQQLRPKINNYALTVEKGSGYDLNRSLFERLVLKGYPHQTLKQQHRMRPEIANFVRRMTYPDLLDGPKTEGRPHIRGLRSNIIFIDHEHQEDIDPRDSKDRSRINKFEAEMILKIVKYLGQQGYGTDKLVILTPYLGQLSLLRQMLSATHDPVLNDLDSWDLVKAGLVTQATAKIAKSPIRLATIDNYQGEESHIVIASLTRSNPQHDIGFMSSPERLNVLLSRARDGLVIIGNTDTYQNPRKGQEIWKHFFRLIEEGNYAFEGLPTRCERHPQYSAVLKRPEDFDRESPDGGCLEPCRSFLNCGLHLCPSKCHQIVDHSKILCTVNIWTTCSQGHSTSRLCHKPQPGCKTCDRELERAAEALRRAAERQRARDKEQAEHEATIAALDASIEAEAAALRDEQVARQRKNVELQKKHDLASAIARRPGSQSSPLPPLHASSAQPPSPDTAEMIQTPVGGPAVAATPASQNIGLSPAEGEWMRQKTVENAKNDHLDKLMSMIGLEKVKEEVLALKGELEVSIRQGTSLSEKNLNVALLGNPGTGKTTVARHYAAFLTSIGVLPGTVFIETTGVKLANDGVAACEKMIKSVVSGEGGAIFVDEAYQLTSGHNPGGRAVLDLLLTSMLDHIGKIVFIFAGYNRNMESFFEANPGLPSRIPHKFQFHDYSDRELGAIFDGLITKKYGKQMAIEGGKGGLYVRIAVRRVGRARGRDGFGNARAISNLLSQVTQRQAQRIIKERREGRRPNDFLLTKEDLIGPDPSGVTMSSDSWQELQSMIGLDDVKASIQSLVDMVITNYHRELAEKEPMQVSLNRVFLGNPGTGKTSVANLYGRILVDLGTLSNGEVIIKNPSDFIGDVVGASEANTKAILSTTRGKVLVIDEAYGLYEKSGQSAGFKTAVIDTIVAEVQSTPGEDRCVLLLGYKEQMVEMFQHVNPGLSRRFAIEDAFAFADFTTPQLEKILHFKMKKQDLSITPSAEAVALEVLSRARVRPHFGNAGEVENMIGKAKSRYQARQSRLPIKQRASDVVFMPEDFDPDFARSQHAGQNLVELFKDMVGMDSVVERLGKIQRAAELMKKRGMDYRAETPTTFVFKGPPGTGKTSIARKIGKVYHDLGFLASTEIVECSASELVAQYVGQTGPLVRQKFDQALGKVLFIDEAYRLAEGSFAKEAVDEIVDCLTKEIYRGRLIVILAGYTDDINNLLAVNPGLASRFTEEVPFQPMRPAECLSLLRATLQKKDIVIDDTAPSSDGAIRLRAIFSELCQLPGWGNARDVLTLAKKMTVLALQESHESESLHLQLSTAEDCMYAMLQTNRDRSKVITPHRRSDYPPIQLPPTPTNTTAPNVSTTTKSISAYGLSAAPHAADTLAACTDPRDAGVSDAIWAQLLLDKEAQEQAKQDVNRLEESIAIANATTRELEARAQRASTSEDDDERIRAERLRLEALASRAKFNRAAEALAKQKEEQREARRLDAVAQQKLREMGVCSAGFRWIKQASGYRCAGGSHFIGNNQLGI